MFPTLFPWFSCTLCICFIFFGTKKRDCSFDQGACAIFLSSVETAAKTFGLEAEGSQPKNSLWIDIDYEKHRPNWWVCLFWSLSFWYLMICLYIFPQEYIGDTVVVCSSPFLKITWLGESRLHIASRFTTGGAPWISKEILRKLPYGAREFGMLSWWSRWMVSDCICWEYPNPIPVFNHSLCMARETSKRWCVGCVWIGFGDIGITKVHFSQMMRGTIVWMCLKSHSQKGGILSTSITSSIRKSKRFLIHIAIVHVSIAEEPIVWLLGPCWTLFFVIAGCSWLFLFWNLTNLRADISFVPHIKVARVRWSGECRSALCNLGERWQVWA